MFALLLLTAGVPEAMSEEIVLADRNIHVGDIARAPGFESEVVGVLSQHSTLVELDECSARRMLRNRFPALEFVLRFDGRVRLSHPSPSQVRGGSCFGASVDLAIGETITASNVVEIECPSERTVAALGYDAASGSPYARGFIPAGTNLGALRLNGVEVVPEGKAMTLRFAAGPIIVERDVASLQPGVPGGRVFVKTEDGKVISARLSPGETGASQ